MIKDRWGFTNALGLVILSSMGMFIAVFIVDQSLTIKLGYFCLAYLVFSKCLEEAINLGKGKVKKYV